MDTADTLRYHRDGTPEAKLRRFLIAFATALLLATVLSGWLQLITYFVPQFGELYLKFAALFQFLPEEARKLPWSLSTHLVVTLGLALVLLNTRFPRVLDFLLFGDYDKEVLTPIGQQTGILKWRRFESGSQHEAWTQLLAWAAQGAGDGRWRLEWLFHQPQVPEPFSWTVLIGPNGVGKSQVARELGRYLGSMDRGAENLGPFSRLGIWWRRVVPRTRRRESDPWHTGHIVKVGDRPDAVRFGLLDSWRPSAPTLMILDDPAIGTAGLVIEKLEARQKLFWYPVRLVVIDQFIPADLPIDSDHDRAAWHFKNAPSVRFTPVVLREEIIDVAKFRALLGEGVWIYRNREAYLVKGTDISALYGTKALQQLVDVLEGNPLLVALAMLWFAEDLARTVPELLRTDMLTAEEEQIFSGDQKELKTLVAHRLIRERVEDLYDGYINQETGKGTAVRLSVACATLANGMDIEQARNIFGLAFSQDVLRRIFPDGADGVHQIPALRPWLIGESFLKKVYFDILDKSATGWQDLLLKAFAANSRGTLKTLTRRTSLPMDLATLLKALPPAHDQTEQLGRFIALAEYVLFSQGYAYATTDNGLALSLTLDALAALDDTLVADAAGQLDRLISARLPTIPAAIPRMTLCCILASRLLAIEPDGSQSFLATTVKLERLCLTLPPLKTLPQSVRHQLDAAMMALGFALLEQIERYPDSEQLPALHALHQNFAAFFDAPLLVAFTSSPSSRLRNGICNDYLRLLKMRADALYGNYEKVDTGIADFLDQLLPKNKAEELFFSVLAIRTKALAYLKATDQQCRLEALVHEIDDIVRPFVNDVNLQEQRARAWLLAIDGHIHGSDLAQIEAKACMVDEIARPFPNNPTMQALRAEAWQSLAIFCCDQPLLRKETERAAHVVDEIGGPFADDPYTTMHRAGAWRAVVAVLGHQPEAEMLLEPLALTVDRLAESFPDCAILQLERAAVWKLFIWACAELPEQRALAEPAARNVDAIARPFPDYEDLQLARAQAWQHTSRALALQREQRVRAEIAARHVDQIALRFADAPGFQLARAAAWRHVAWANAHMEDKREQTEVIARYIDEIAHPFSSDQDFQLERASAWHYVIMALVDLPEQHAQIMRKIQVVGEIVKPFPDSIRLHLEHAEAWLAVARFYSRSMDHAQLQIAVRNVESIAERFPEAPKIRAACNEATQLLRQGASEPTS